MGALLSLIKPGGQGVGFGVVDVVMDFENAKPTKDEQELFDQVQSKLKEAKLITDKLRCYTGCGDLIRKAISAPCRENEDAAWAAVCPAVSQLKDFFEFSSTLEALFLRLLQHVCGTGDPSSVRENLEQYQATANLLAQLLIFASDFDELKMSNPSVQNDFSYYRRTLSRLRMSTEHRALLDSAVVKDELANRMSLFYAYPTPMLKTLVDRLSTTTSIPKENMTYCLGLMIGVCHGAVNEHRTTTEQQMTYCLRVMVACIILYDHLDSLGAFHRDSDINMKSIVKLIQSRGTNQADSLMNSLRYTSKHLNDESTPKSVKALFG